MRGGWCPRGGARLRGATRPCFRPRWRRPVGSRLVFGSSLLPSRVAPLQLIGLISGVMTGVTAGADIGLTGAADGIIGFERFAAALRAGFFRAAFLAGFLFEAFLEDFFFELFFFELFFFEAFFLATRFLEDFLEDFFEDFFLAFFAPDFFLEAFFFAAIVKLLFNVGPIVCRALLPPGGLSHYQAFDSHRTRLVSGFYAQQRGMHACQG